MAKEIVCEVCGKTEKNCKCKTSNADYIESIPDDKFNSIISQIKNWGKKSNNDTSRTKSMVA